MLQAWVWWLVGAPTRPLGDGHGRSCPATTSDVEFFEDAAMQKEARFRRLRSRRHSQLKEKRFRSERALGRGYLTDVSSALTDGGEAVVLKRLNALAMKTSPGPAEVEAELWVLSALRHDRIVAVRGYTALGSGHAIVAELVDGCSLQQLLYGRGLQDAHPHEHQEQTQQVDLQQPGLHGVLQQQDQHLQRLSGARGKVLRAARRVGAEEVLGQAQLTLQQRLRIALDVAQGLCYLHTQGVVHGNVRPSNVLVDRSLRARVSDFRLRDILDPLWYRDFGSSWVLEEKDALWYVDPSILHDKALKPWSDVYGFGMVLLTLISGKGPRVTDPEDLEAVNANSQQLLMLMLQQQEQGQQGQRRQGMWRGEAEEEEEDEDEGFEWWAGSSSPTSHLPSNFGPSMGGGLGMAGDASSYTVGPMASPPAHWLPLREWADLLMKAGDVEAVLDTSLWLELQARECFTGWRQAALVGEAGGSDAEEAQERGRRAREALMTVRACLDLCFRCLDWDPVNRPHMGHVAETLECLLEIPGSDYKNSDSHAWLQGFWEGFHGRGPTQPQHHAQDAHVDAPARAEVRVGAATPHGGQGGAATVLASRGSQGSETEGGHGVSSPQGGQAAELGRVACDSAAYIHSVAHWPALSSPQKEAAAAASAADVSTTEEVIGALLSGDERIPWVQRVHCEPSFLPGLFFCSQHLSAGSAHDVEERMFPGGHSESMGHCRYACFLRSGRVLHMPQALERSMTQIGQGDADVPDCVVLERRFVLKVEQGHMGETLKFGGIAECPWEEPGLQGRMRQSGAAARWELREWSLERLNLEREDWGLLQRALPSSPGQGQVEQWVEELQLAEVDGLRRESCTHSRAVLFQLHRLKDGGEPAEDLVNMSGLPRACRRTGNGGASTQVGGNTSCTQAQGQGQSMAGLGIARIPDALMVSILQRVSRAQVGYSHSLVCRRWRDLAPCAQVCLEVGQAGRGLQAGLLEEGALLRELAKFSSLTSLTVGAAAVVQLTDEFLQWLGASQRRLRELVLVEGAAVRGCAFSPAGLHALFCSLPRLRRLDLGDHNCCPWDIPELLSRIAQLRQLHLGSPHHGSGACKGPPRALFGLTNLTQLALHARGLLDSMGSLVSLRSLKIFSFHEEHLPASLCSLRALRVLSLSDCFDVEALPQALGELHSLRRLSLHRALNLTRLPDSLGHLGRLTHLELSHCTSLRAFPQSFVGLTALRSLHIRNCPALVRLPSLREFNEMQQLVLCHCPSLVELPADLGSLQKLCLLWLEGLTSLEHLPPSVGCLRSLTVLQITACPALTEPPSALAQLKERA